MKQNIGKNLKNHINLQGWVNALNQPFPYILVYIIRIIGNTVKEF